MSVTHFLRHLFEMTVAMMIGMVGSAAIFVTALGTTVDEALRRHAVAFVVVQALGMTISMVAWMRHRRHSRRACIEMAAAMVVPAIPLVCLRVADVITGSVCGFYCASTIVAMLVVMLYRRSEYSGHTVLVPAR
ncbi:MAG TPA: hypothetical protein VE596_16740 [Gaiellaceae bacterium]|jgi:hypothetical protein|nr:hypothetical protein [Gaiellaceae bacterium]